MLALLIEGGSPGSSIVILSCVEPVYLSTWFILLWLSRDFLVYSKNNLTICKYSGNNDIYGTKKESGTQFASWNTLLGQLEK